MDSRASPAARLLIADDHDLVREGMRAMLVKEPDIEVAGEAANGREALELCRLLRPDLVLMDIRMPEMDGVTATREIKREHPTISVLMVTTYESPEHLLEAIKAGAAGYVLKDATKRQLLNAVHRVLQGESPLNQELAMRLLQRMVREAARRMDPLPGPADKRRQEPTFGPSAEPLSAKELEVLRLLVRGRTNRDAAEELGVSLSTVKNHVHHIITKLGVSDRTQAAVRGIKLGLIPEVTEEE